MKISVITAGMLAVNIYFLYDETDMVIVDPGASISSIRRAIEMIKRRPVAILLTHGHFDHIGAANQLKEELNIPIYAGANEKEILLDPAKNLTAQFGTPLTIQDFIPVKHDDELEFLNTSWRVIETPGHTIGSVCYHIPQENMLISGDTLFQGSYGRIDFPTSNPKMLYDSITQRLFRLPDATEVYPGHGNPTTILIEKKTNPVYYIDLG